jgi:hypothetical protein
MPIEKAGKSRVPIGLVIAGIIVFGLGALSAKALLMREVAPNNRNNNSPLLTEGFDFSHLRSPEVEWRGPDIGVKLDLNRLSSNDGLTLASVVGKRPIMLVSVNPTCAMCKTAKDEMSYLRQKLTSKEIQYYMVCFDPKISAEDFFSYSDSLKVEAPAFLWNKQEGLPPKSVLTMVNPAHLLLNSDGTVIRVWPGSNKDKGVRDRMANQIVSDTSVATDTLSAVVLGTSTTR